MKMTSKEALKELYRLTCINDRNNVWSSCELCAVILQDLERLEKFYKLCLTKYVPLDSLSPSFWESKEEWLKTMSYDYYIFLCEDVCEYVVKERIRLTLDEFNFIYNLLKEVLE